MKEKNSARTFSCGGALQRRTRLLFQQSPHAVFWDFIRRWTRLLFQSWFLLHAFPLPPPFEQQVEMLGRWGRLHCGLHCHRWYQQMQQTWELQLQLCSIQNMRWDSDGRQANCSARLLLPLGCKRTTLPEPICTSTQALLLSRNP